MAFDFPVPTGPGQQVLGGLLAGRAGNCISDFTRFFALGEDTPFDATRLGQSGPVQMTGQACRTEQPPTFSSAMPFVESLGLIQLSLSLPFGRWGEKLPEIRLAAFRRVRADCLSRPADNVRHDRGSAGRSLADSGSHRPSQSAPPKKRSAAARDQQESRYRRPRSRIWQPAALQNLSTIRRQVCRAGSPNRLLKLLDGARTDR